MLDQTKSKILEKIELWKGRLSETEIDTLAKEAELSTDLQIIALFIRLLQNTETSQKFRRLKEKILPVLSFEDFFQNFLSEIKNIFGIPYVWFYFYRHLEIVNLIKRLTSEEVQAEIKTISKKNFDQILDGRKVILADKELQQYRKLVPKNVFQHIKSLALVEFKRNGKLTGVLGLGHTDMKHFTPHLDPEEVKSLATDVSICLSNVASHEKLKIEKEKEKQKKEKYRKLLDTDSLTNLLSLRVVEDSLNMAFEKAKKYGDHVCLIYFDLDKFKELNDSLGHEAGDEILKAFANAMIALMRPEDIKIRLHGDEFAAIVFVDKERADNIAQEMKAFFRNNPFEYEGNKTTIQFTYGIVSYEELKPDEKNPKEFLKRADTELYKHKKRRQEENGSSR